MTQEQLDNIFTYHVLKDDQPVRYIELRNKAKELAELINMNCPESREKDLAFTNLQQCSMWANASIAINE